MLSCSIINARMLNTFFPKDISLAQKTVELYPEQITALYWLFESLKEEDIYNRQKVLEKIVNIKPNEGYAWRWLGTIYENQGLMDLAINAYIQTCENGDFGSHGCYGAGCLLEQQGKYLEAIDYYELSKWEPSRVKGRLLELLLTSGELAP